MEHFILLGLAALVIGLLLMSLGPRIATTPDLGGNDLLASSSLGKSFSSKSQVPNDSSHSGRN